MSARATRWSIGILLLADAAALRWTGLGWGAQLACAAVLGAWVGLGLLLLSFVDEDDLQLDGTARFLVAALAGSVVYAALAFVLFHTAVMNALGLPDVRAAAQLAILLVAPPALLGFRRARPWPAAPPATVPVLALASVLAAATAFGFQNNELEEKGDLRRWLALPRAERKALIPSWGAPYDRNIHFFAGDVARLGFPNGFPNGHASHVGVATLVTGVSYLTSGFSLIRFSAISKPLCLLWLFAALYATHAMARRLGCSERVAFLAALGVALYAPLHFGLLRDTLQSQRILPAAGTLYHNVTQQSSFALGLAGLLLAGRDLVRPSRAFVLGCGLVAGSFFFKPSLFTVVVPPLALVALWRAEAGRRRTVVAGLALTVAVALAWAAYPYLMRYPGQPVPVTKVAWLDLQSQKATPMIPWTAAGPLAVLASVLVVGHASLIVPVTAAAARWLPRLRAGVVAALREVPPVALVLVAAFLIGQVTGLYLVDPGPKRSHGHFLFGLAIGTLLLLPLVVREVARLPWRALRAVAWSAYAAQLASGAWNLWIYVYYGRL